jgi:hypothetical protein
MLIPTLNIYFLIYLVIGISFLPFLRMEIGLIFRFSTLISVLINQSQRFVNLNPPKISPPSVTFIYEATGHQLLDGSPAVEFTGPFHGPQGHSFDDYEENKSGPFSSVITTDRGSTSTFSVRA